MLNNSLRLNILFAEMAKYVHNITILILKFCEKFSYVYPICNGFILKEMVFGTYIFYQYFEYQNFEKYLLNRITIETVESIE